MPQVDRNEAQWTAIRAQGAGGQNVNKVSSAVQLRFDIRASSLPDGVKARLLARDDRRINAEGVIVIKAQRHRSQPMNVDDAFARLDALVAEAAEPARERKATKPTRASQRRRLESKKQQSALKVSRRDADGSG